MRFFYLNACSKKQIKMHFQMYSGEVYSQCTRIMACDETKLISQLRTLVDELLPKLSDDLKNNVCTSYEKRKYGKHVYKKLLIPVLKFIFECWLSKLNVMDTKNILSNYANYPRFYLSSLIHQLKEMRLKVYKTYDKFSLPY